MAKDHEWDSFIDNNENFVDPKVPVRRVEHIDYPGKEHPAASEVRAGMLERKSKYLKSYTPGWYDCSLPYACFTKSNFLGMFYRRRIYMSSNRPTGLILKLRSCLCTYQSRSSDLDLALTLLPTNSCLKDVKLDRCIEDTPGSSVPNPVIQCLRGMMT